MSFSVISARLDARLFDHGGPLLQGLIAAIAARVSMFWIYWEKVKALFRRGKPPAR